jgi:hypothetical protein
VTVREGGAAESEPLAESDQLPDDVFVAQGEDGRVSVEGLPVPIVPGSRVTDARPDTPRPPQPPRPPRPPHPPKPPVHRAHVPPRPPHPPAPPRPPQPPRPPAPEPSVEPVVITGLRSATEERAQDEVRRRLRERVTEWLAPEVPTSWRVSQETLADLVRGEAEVTPIELKDGFGTVYEAKLRADLSPERRAELVEDYQHEQTLKKVGVLAALLVFALFLLGTLSGYIRADEATKGYYTNRLRLAAMLGAGAAGVALYRWLV